MARKSTGVLGAMGNLWRWTIWGLAAVLVIAIGMNFVGEDAEDVAVATPEAAPVEEAPAPEPEAEVEPEPEAETEEVPADDPELVLRNAIEGAVEAAEEQVQERVDELATEVEEEVDELAEEVREAANELQSRLDEAMGAGDDERAADPGPAESDADEAVTETAAEPDAPSLFDTLAPIQIPGDEASYELLNAFRRDDGKIEITTSRTLGEEITQTIRLVTCAPLAVGTIAEGDGARNDAPEMERIPLGTASATLAAMACGAFR